MDRRRRLIRVTLFVAVVNYALTFALQTSVWTPEMRLAMQVLGCVAATVGVVGQFAMFKYISMLALRIPDDRIARRAHLLMYALGIPALMLVALRVWTTFSQTAARSFVGFGLAVGLVLLALIVFGIMDLIMMLRLQKRFKEQAILARQIWSSTSNMPQIAE